MERIGDRQKPQNRGEGKGVALQGKELMEMRKGMERIKKNEEREEKRGLLVDHKSRNLTGGNSLGGGCFSFGEQKMHQN